MADTPRALSQPAPLGDADLDELQSLLDAVPAPLEPLDASSLDGYLCGVLLQPKPVPAASWLAPVVDVDGRPAPARYPLARLHALVQRRHAELGRAIANRQWFDPWVFQLDDEASASDSALPWVAGFATAMAFFPQLMRIDDPALLEPLAVLYLHLDPDDLEDADELLEAIESLEPPADLDEAVEDIVQSVLRIADVSLPAASPGAGAARRPNAAAPGRRPGSPPGRRR